MRIALIGRKAAGKTMVAFYLKKNHGFRILRLSDSVTKLIRTFYVHRPHERVNWQRKLELYDKLYELDNEIHLNYLMKRLKTTRSDTDLVIDDPRYMNEVEALKKLGFIIIRVTMPESKRRQLINRRTASAGAISLSEYFDNESDKFPVDYSILNHSREGIQKILERIIEKEREREQRETI